MLNIAVVESIWLDENLSSAGWVISILGLFSQKKKNKNNSERLLTGFVN